MAGAGYSPGSECAGQSPEGFTPGENDRLDGLYRDRPGAPELVDCGDLREAVDRARAMAKPGDVVILSPASASFDRFKNFAERGNAFKDLVNALE